MKFVTARSRCGGRQAAGDRQRDEAGGGRPHSV